MEITQTNTTRFQDQNLTIYHFYTRILVHCPNCQKQAEVNTNPKTHISRFDCYQCHHQFSSDNKRIDLSLRVYCNACAHQIIITIPNVKSKKQAIKVKCPACGDQQSYPPTYREYIQYSLNNDAKDPFLGLDLWYQAKFKDELFWAFNYEHLQYVEQYVAAKLRERNNRLSMTMVEKLPEFIKSAKNRQGLLKLINKLKTSNNNKQ